MRKLCSFWIATVAISAGPAHGQPAPAKVTVAAAEVRALPDSTTLVGTVQPVTRSLIATEVSGIVQTLAARQGDAVEEGQVLCKLNDDAISLQVREAQARLDSLRAQLSEFLAGTRKTELERRKALYEAAKAEFDRWGFERERVRVLQTSTQSNPKEVYDTQASYLAAQARMQAARAEYDLGVEGPRPEEIERARFAVAEQEAAVARLERDLAKTEIRAPFDGFVVRLESEVGEWIAVGSPVLELVDLSPVLVRVDAPENAFPFVKVGDRATVTVDALKNIFVGGIRHAIPQADEAARTFPVEIEIPNQDRILKAGMFARATLVTGPSADVVAVPKDAVARQRGVAYVAIVRPGPTGPTAYPTPVTTGLDIDDWVAITSGNVPPGTQVVVRGNEMLTLIPAPSPVEIMGGAQGTATAPGAPGSVEPAADAGGQAG